MSVSSKQGITFALDAINGGGAERVTVMLANYWVNVGRNVALITFTSSRAVDYYTLDPRVKRIHLNEIDVPWFTRTLWGKQEENIEKLRVALMLAGNKNVVAIMSKMSIRCILANDSGMYNIYACERCYMPHTLFTKLDEYLRKVLYPKAKKVVIQVDKGSREWLNENVGKCDISVIPNCLTDKVISEIEMSKAPEKTGERYILNCGRLTGQKQQDKLIKAYAMAVAANPELNVRLKIVGVGELEGELVELAQRLGVGGSVDFLGWRKDVYSLMKGALVFALTSGYEGFPMALLEAMATGTPAIAFDCLTGPSELIRHGDNGLLVELDNIEQFSEALNIICSDDVLRDSLSKKALSVRERFSQKKVIELWEKILFVE